MLNLDLRLHQYIETEKYKEAIMPFEKRFNFEDEDANTVKIFVLRESDMSGLFLEHYAVDVRQNDDSIFHKPALLGLPGGQVDEIDCEADPRYRGGTVTFPILEAAARRELKEETGVEPPANAIYESLVFHAEPSPSQRDKKGKHSVHYFFMLFPDDGIVTIEPNNPEIKSAHWFPLNQLPLPAKRGEDKYKNLYLPYTQFLGIIGLFPKIESARYEDGTAYFEDGKEWVRIIRHRFADYTK